MCSRMKISSKDILKLRKLKLKQVSCSEHIEKIAEGKKFLSCDSRHVSIAVIDGTDNFEVACIQDSVAFFLKTGKG